MQIIGEGSCIVCASRDLVDVLQTPRLPVICNRLHHTAEEARWVSRAGVALTGCRCCGHLFNAAFDPALVDYDSTYENSLMGSPRYRQYTIDLIERMLAAHDLKGGTVVEIGCGRGEFLRMLCERGIRRAIGFDPGRPGETAKIGEASLEIVDASFDSAAAPPAPDLVCTRHVLEHLSNPISLLQSVARAYASTDHGVLFIEVPNGAYMAERLCIWDLIYAHVSYFFPSSLSWALRSAGFMAEQIDQTFGGQFLTVETKLRRSTARHTSIEPSPEPAQAFEALQAGFVRTVAAWDQWLRAAKDRGRRVALWGAGAKGVTFLNLLTPPAQLAVEVIIDINPLKSGTFIAGTGHPIAVPSVLKEFKPDAVLVMNPEYIDEINQMLIALDIRADLVTVSGFN